MSSPAVPWVPEGFEGYRDLYPATPAFAMPDLGPTRQFAAIWRDFGDGGATARRARLTEGARETTFVLLRGFLGNYMPGNLVAAKKALRALGIDAWIANNRAGATIAENARAVAAEVKGRVPAQRRLVFLGHSKGGLEALSIAAADPALAARTRAIVLSQTPRGPSAVLESLLLRRHEATLPGAGRRWAERMQRTCMHLLRAVPGGTELTRDPLLCMVAALDAAPRPFMLLQTASWSSRPTTWLDSFHERLGEIRPGAAHDGQFYVEDLIWPGVPHILLPHLDHAQPVVGGFGFDSARYWLAMSAWTVDQLT